MSYVEGWIAAIKTTMSPGMPIRLGKKVFLTTLQYAIFKLCTQLSSKFSSDMNELKRLRTTRHIRNYRMTRLIP